MKTGRIFMLFLLVMIGCAGPVLGADCTCDVNRDGEITPLDALLLSDKIRGNCPTSLGIPCEDICSDVNADGSLNDEDVNMIFDRFFGQAGKCAVMPVCDQCYYKQDRAKQTIRDIASYMEKFYAEYDYYLFSLDKYGISVKNDAYYEYSIHEVENDPESYRIIASSKSPGINGGGKGDDVWTLEWIYGTGLNLIHTVNGCPACPENNCLSCFWNQESVKKNLTTISRNEEAYFSEYDTYTGSLSEIGFSPSVYDKYGYTITADSTAYLATAASKAPGIMGGGAGDDVWTIDQSLTMTNTMNACYECPALYRSNCQEYLEKTREARQSLGIIAKNEEAYYSEQDTYTADLQRIGFSIPSNSYYDYSIQATKETFIATATSKEPGITGKGSGDDIWTMNEMLKLIHVVNACPACPGITSDTLRTELPMMGTYSYSKCVVQQNSARKTLTAIAQAESNFFSQNNRFTDRLYELNEFGLPYPNTSKSSYGYWIQISNGGNSFVATARSYYSGINGGGYGDDEWTIDQNMEIRNTTDACACYLSGECPMYYIAENEGLFANISDTAGGVTAVVSLGRTPNDVASVAFDLLYDPAVLTFKTSLPGLLLQNFDKFSVKEITPGRIRVGGYTTGTPIPENTDGTLATLTFDILGPCSTDLKFVSLKDNMVSWQEHTLRYNAGNDLAHAIALLRIAAGQNAEIPACVPDIGNDGKKGLAEAVYLLQETAGLR